MTRHMWRRGGVVVAATVAISVAFMGGGESAAGPPQSADVAVTPPPPFAVEAAIVLSPTMVEVVEHGAVVATHDVVPDGGYTIPQVATLVGDPALLASTSPGIYLLQAALVAGPGTSLEIASPQVTALHLADGLGVFLGGDGAQASVDHVMITSWDTGTGAAETASTPGRPFILFEDDSNLVLDGAWINDLGSVQTGAAGVTWKNDAHPGGATDTVFSGGQSGAVVMKSGPGTFIDDTFASNAQDGLRLTDGDSGATLVGNVAEGNGASGFEISQSSGGFWLLGNSAKQNRTGILLENVSGAPTLTSNRVVQNSEIGIALRDTSGAQLRRTNTTSDGTGLEISGASRAVRVDSLVSRGDQVGVAVHRSSVPELAAVTIRDAIRTGVIADSKGLVIDRATISATPVGVEVRRDASLEQASIAATHRALVGWPGQKVTATNSQIRAGRIGVELERGAQGDLDNSRIIAPEATLGGSTTTHHSLLSQAPVSWPILLGGIGLLLVCVLIEVLRRYRERWDPDMVAPMRTWNVT